MTTIYNSSITSFKELMDEIAYSFTDTKERYINLGNGDYVFNKLYISPTEVSYKTDLWKLDSKVYQKFLKFMELLEE